LDQALIRSWNARQVMHTHNSRSLSPSDEGDMATMVLHSTNPSIQNSAGVNKRYRPVPAKTFQCRGYGECRMVFSRSEHLARHIRSVSCPPRFSFFNPHPRSLSLSLSHISENTRANDPSHVIVENNFLVSIISVSMPRRFMQTSKNRMNA
jgi:hypothetical protein